MERGGGLRAGENNEKKTLRKIKKSKSVITINGNGLNSTILRLLD